MTTHQNESEATAIKAAIERRDNYFERARKREEWLIVTFVGIFGCAAILLLLGLAHR